MLDNVVTPVIAIMISDVQPIGNVEPTAGALTDVRQIQHDKQRERYYRRLRVLCPILFAGVFFVYSFTTHLIPSRSMLPTLRPGDQILTERAWLAYPFGRMPSRGDVIVFDLPEIPVEEAAQTAAGYFGIGRTNLGVFRTRGTVLIKRVVGLPGDTVHVRADGIYINGKLLTEDHRDRGTPANLACGGTCGTIKPFTCGADELYVLGDNSAESDDSRYWGALNRDDVIGKFVGVIYHRDIEDRGLDPKRAHSTAAALGGR
jgi:signal peptidase I